VNMIRYADDEAVVCDTQKGLQELMSMKFVILVSLLLTVQNLNALLAMLNAHSIGQQMEFLLK